MADPIIDDIVTVIINHRHTAVHPNKLREWAHHLRDVVQPQLDELEALKSARRQAKLAEVRA